MDIIPCLVGIMDIIPWLAGIMDIIPCLAGIMSIINTAEYLIMLSHVVLYSTKWPQLSHE